ncbi:MAG: tRNA (adenosine(37)-N6)-threonylcarbamoyltransferase complex dimerization subunit type 1 TsaB [Thermodesulfobacteriota bacterium]
MLAIDTSTTSGAVALFDGDILIAERTVGDVGTHADWLMQAIAALLDEAGAPVNDVGLFALSHGPGSFTGLRIGVSTIKGLAWAAGRPVAGVSTLEALAYNARYSNLPVCPVLDARKKEVYAALFSFSGGGLARVLMPDSALTPVALFEFLEREGLSEKPVIFLGNGIKVYSEVIKKNVKRAIFAPGHLWHVRASNIALIARQKGLKGVSALDSAPVYYRKSEAELKSRKGP